MTDTHLRGVTSINASYANIRYLYPMLTWKQAARIAWRTRFVPVKPHGSKFWVVVPPRGAA